LSISRPAASREQLGAQPRRGRVGIDGEQDGDALLRAVREVDACVRTHEAVMGFADHHAVSAAHDPRSLAEHHLDVAGILVVLRRDRDRLLGGLDAGE
jgi:hypothetical protein